MRSAGQQVLEGVASSVLDLDRVGAVMQILDGAATDRLGLTPSNGVVLVAGDQAGVRFVPDFDELAELVPDVGVAGVLGQPPFGVVPPHVGAIVPAPFGAEHPRNLGRLNCGQWAA